MQNNSYMPFDRERKIYRSDIKIDKNTRHNMTLCAFCERLFFSQ